MNYEEMKWTMVWNDEMFITDCSPSEKDLFVKSVTLKLNQGRKRLIDWAWFYVCANTI